MLRDCILQNHGSSKTTAFSHFLTFVEIDFLSKLISTLGCAFLYILYQKDKV